VALGTMALGLQQASNRVSSNMGKAIVDLINEVRTSAHKADSKVMAASEEPGKGKVDLEEAVAAVGACRRVMDQAIVEARNTPKSLLVLL